MLAIQQPLEIPGVRPFDLLVAAGADPTDLRERMRDEAERVELRPEVLERFVNVDLSGGERKRAEMVQFGVLRPKFAVLDEIDSGLDVDALGAVARRLSRATTEWDCGVLAITHFRRLLQELTPTDDPRRERRTRRGDRRPGTRRDPRTRRLRALSRRDTRELGRSAQR